MTTLTLEGPTITRDLSMDDMRAYLRSDGYTRAADNEDGGEVWRKGSNHEVFYCDNALSERGSLVCAVGSLAKIAGCSPGEMLAKIAGVATRSEAVQLWPIEANVLAMAREIEARANAQQHRWLCGDAYRPGDATFVVVDEHGNMLATCHGPNRDAMATFICDLRAQMPVIAGELRQLSDENAELRDKVEAMETGYRVFELEARVLTAEKDRDEALARLDPVDPIEAHERHLLAPYLKPAARAEAMIESWRATLTKLQETMPPTEVAELLKTVGLALPCGHDVAALDQGGHDPLTGVREPTRCVACIHERDKVIYERRRAGALLRSVAAELEWYEREHGTGSIETALSMQMRAASRVVRTMADAAQHLARLDDESKAKITPAMLEPIATVIKEHGA